MLLLFSLLHLYSILGRYLRPPWTPRCRVPRRLHWRNHLPDLDLECPGDVMEDQQGAVRVAGFETLPESEVEPGRGRGFLLGVARLGPEVSDPPPDPGQELPVLGAVSPSASLLVALALHAPTEWIAAPIANTDDGP